jgi:hypothetical protein
MEGMNTVTASYANVVKPEDVTVTLTMPAKYAKFIHAFLGPHSNRSMAEHIGELSASKGAYIASLNNEDPGYCIYSEINQVLSDLGIAEYK